MNQGQPAKGILLMVGSCIAFCVMSALISYASFIDSYKTALFRFIIGLGLLGTAALFGKIKLNFEHGPFLFLRGLTGGASVLFFYLAIAKLGIGKATVIIYSYPIFASIFGAIFLREKIGGLKLGAIITACVGIYLLTQNENTGFSFLTTMGGYELIAILGAILSGIAVVLVKQLHETDSTYAIYFAQCVIGFWIVIIPANLVPISIGYLGGMLLLCIGTVATIGQLLMTEGYRHVSVTTGSLLGMLVPVLNFCVGATIFHEPISSYAVVGSMIVLTSCIAILVAK